MINRHLNARGSSSALDERGRLVFDQIAAALTHASNRTNLVITGALQAKNSDKYGRSTAESPTAISTCPLYTLGAMHPD